MTRVAGAAKGSPARSASIAAVAAAVHERMRAQASGKYREEMWMGPAGRACKPGGGRPCGWPGRRGVEAGR
eukprot:86161-Prymnesium_polylepis.1